MRQNPGDPKLGCDLVNNTLDLLLKHSVLIQESLGSAKAAVISIQLGKMKGNGFLDKLKRPFKTEAQDDDKIATYLVYLYPSESCLFSRAGRQCLKNLVL